MSVKSDQTISHTDRLDYVDPVRVMAVFHKSLTTSTNINNDLSEYSISFRQEFLTTYQILSAAILVNI